MDMDGWLKMNRWKERRTDIYGLRHVSEMCQSTVCCNINTHKRKCLMVYWHNLTSYQVSVGKLHMFPFIQQTLAKDKWGFLQ